MPPTFTAAGAVPSQHPAAEVLPRGGGGGQVEWPSAAVAPTDSHVDRLIAVQDARRGAGPRRQPAAENSSSSVPRSRTERCWCPCRTRERPPVVPPRVPGGNERRSPGRRSGRPPLPVPPSRRGQTREIGLPVRAGVEQQSLVARAGPRNTWRDTRRGRLPPRSAAAGAWVTLTHLPAHFAAGPGVPAACAMPGAEVTASAATAANAGQA